MRFFSITTALILSATALLSGCISEAERATQNLKVDADNFNVFRKIIFYNSVTGENIATFEGFCSIKDELHQLELTCDNDGETETHFQGLNERVTYTVIQLKPVNVSRGSFKVVLRPETVVPEITIGTD